MAFYVHTKPLYFHLKDNFVIFQPGSSWLMPTTISKIGPVLIESVPEILSAELLKEEMWYSVGILNQSSH